MHGRHTRATLDNNRSRFGGSGSRAGLGRGHGRRVDTRTRLATLTAVCRGVAAVAVHATARALGPVAADGVSKSGAAAPIGSRDASGSNGSARGLTKNGLTRGGGGGRAGNSRGCGSLGGCSIRAAVLAAIGNETVTISRAAVAVRAAAPSVSAVGIARGTAEVLTAAAIIAGGDSGSCGRDRCGWSVGAARQASGSAVSLGGSTPTVLRTAPATVDCAVGVAEQVAVGRAALAVLGVLGLALLGNDLEMGRRDLRVIALDVGNTRVVVTAVLTSQAAAGSVDIAGRVDPVEVDVG